MRELCGAAPALGPRAARRNMEPPLAGMKEPTPNQIRPELRALPGTTRRRRLGLAPPRPPWNSSIDVRAARSDEHLCIDLIWGAWFVDLI